MKKERTLVIIKPDTLQRSLVGEIFSRIERTGLKLVAIKMVRPTQKQLYEHYNKDNVWYEKKGQARVEMLKEAGKSVNRKAIEYGRDIIRGSIKFMTASPLVTMVWEGNQAIGVVKKLVGTTEPLTSDVGTIRGDYQLDSFELTDADGRGSVRNLIHCSDKKSEAKREIKLWFDKNELHDYRHIAEEILYDVNLDGIRE
jgi:nucleoside-diphosphate kinase